MRLARRKEIVRVRPEGTGASTRGSQRDMGKDSIFS